jgi:hypothetical protein
MVCQSNAKPSEKDHDLPKIRNRDLWCSSQHTQPLHHLGCTVELPYRKSIKKKIRVHLLKLIEEKNGKKGKRHHQDDKQI